MKTDIIHNEQIRRFFIKDSKLPIHVVNEQIFSYLLDLYEPWLGSRSLWNQMQSDIAKFENIDQWYTKKSQMRAAAQEFIEKSEACKKIKGDFNAIQAVWPAASSVAAQTNVFNLSHNGQMLISIDMVKANWQIWKLLGLEGEADFGRWLESFGFGSFSSSAKMLRQSLLGEIEPKRIQSIQKSITFSLAQELKKEGFNIVAATSDEIVLASSESALVGDCLRAKEIVSANPHAITFRMTPWHLAQMYEGRNWMLQHVYEDVMSIKQSSQVGAALEGAKSFAFRNVPKHYTAQVYKEYTKQEIVPEDLLFEQDEQLAKWLQPLELKAVYHATYSKKLKR